MKPSNLYISVAILLGNLLSLSLSSCQADADAPTPTSKMSVSFRVETRSGEQSDASSEPSTGYEEATKWENYINIANNDYRIGFFDDDNNCITRFIPEEITAVNTNTYTDYTLEGKLPAILTLYSNFKIVVLANWENYPEMTTGTSLDAICCPTGSSSDGSPLGQFKHFDDAIGYSIPTSTPESGETDDTRAEETEAEETPRRYVPMYGVKEYKNVVFGFNKENDATVVSAGEFGPINMLRAIAKVEVVFETTDPYTLETDLNDPTKSKPLYITNYNDYGYCAPEGAYSEEDYYHKDWNTDYWQGHLHLVGGKNHSEETKTLAMTPMTVSNNNDDETDATEGGESTEKIVWVAYLPEYRNVALTSTTGDGKNPDCKNAAINNEKITPARIAVPLLRNGELHTSYIDFATYDNDGELTPGSAINIERNNLYRFTITHVDQGLKWKVKALPWNGLKHDPIVM